MNSQTTEAKPHVYDVLAKAFIQEGVKTCFTLMGDANMNWASRLMQQGCRMIYVRHEHCALAAAMAYARNGTLWVLEEGKSALHRFSADRKWLGATEGFEGRVQPTPPLPRGARESTAARRL